MTDRLDEARERTFRFVAQVLCFAITALGCGQATAQEEWAEELRAEIALAENCDVDFLSQITDREVDGTQIIFAKVHCTDGRVFDATRTGEFAAFEFSLCPAAREVQSC